MSSPAPIRLLPLLWRKVTWRHWRLAPVQSGLLVGILALGIAVVFAIRLANRAAVASFQNFTDLLTAESDGLISPPAGLLPESVLPELRAALGAEPVQLVAVLETTAARPRTREDEAIGTRETFQLLGVDLWRCKTWRANDALTARGSAKVNRRRRRPTGCPPARRWRSGWAAARCPPGR